MHGLITHNSGLSFSTGCKLWFPEICKLLKDPSCLLLHSLHLLWMYLSSSGILSHMTDPTSVKSHTSLHVQQTYMYEENAPSSQASQASRTLTRVSGRVEISLELCTLQWIYGWAECSVGQKEKVRVRENENNSIGKGFQLLKSILMYSTSSEKLFQQKKSEANEKQESQLNRN